MKEKIAESKITDLSEWLELKCGNGQYINVKRSEIEYVSEDIGNMSEIGLKSGTDVQIDMPYEKLMELV